VRLVIAGTSPVNYLLLIGHIDILPALFDRSFCPPPFKMPLWKLWMQARVPRRNVMNSRLVCWATAMPCTAPVFTSKAAQRKLAVR
jgi:hypothetical protein